jgi:hypothetical protein
MSQDTVAPEAPSFQQQYEDYWGTDETVRWFLPDNQQYFDIQPMNEGAKTRYQKLTNRDIVLSQKREGEAKISVDPAGERHTLIKESVVGWLMMQKDQQGNWSPQPWDKKNLEKWLEVAPPHIVEKLEHKIRLVNPWLQNEMTLEAIDEEIERLYELRKQKVAEEAGEGDSANK